MASPNRWLVLAVVSSALGLIMIDVTVLYTALPRLALSLGTTSSEKLWIVNVYAVVVAGLLPLSGALSDRIGTRQIFVGGLIVFGIASLVAAFSPTASVLIAARVGLAVGAALMMPATLAIIRLTFTDPAERSLAIGVWSSVAAGSAAFGPLLGGILLEFFWWGSVFLINLPVVVVALACTLAYVPRHAGNPNQPIDLIGSAQVMTGLVSLIFLLKALSRPEATLASGAAWFVLSAVSLTLFVHRQMSARRPMVDLGLFRNPVFAAGAVTAVVLYAALIGLEYAVSQRFQLVQGFTPLQAGLGILPIALAALVSGPIAGLWLHRTGPFPWLWGSLLASGLGTAAAGLLAEGGILYQAAALAVVGAAVGTGATAASSAIMLNAPEARAGSAASIEEVSYELGGAIGVAILGGMLAGIYSASFAPPPGAGVSPEARDSFEAAARAAADAGPRLQGLILEAAEAAFGAAYLAVTLAGATLLCVAATALALVSRHLHRR